MGTLRQGNPVVSLTLTPEEIAVVDAFQRAQGLTSRSKALKAMVRFALGDNPQAHSLFSDLPRTGHRRPLTAKAQKLQKRLIERYQSGEI